jgi:hypothetical protein
VLRALLRDKHGKSVMETAMGGDRFSVAACALGSLSSELLLLSHYCGTTDDAAGALSMLEDVLLAMSNRADGAAQMACAELAEAREKAEATP